VLATDSNPAAVLTVKVTSSGQNLGTMKTRGDGNYQLKKNGIANPQNVTVTSDLGGSATGPGKSEVKLLCAKAVRRLWISSIGASGNGRADFVRVLFRICLELGHSEWHSRLGCGSPGVCRPDLAGCASCVTAPGESSPDYAETPGRNARWPHRQDACATSR
jgi:hypothetical protein